jgi:hypothetical protein
MKWMMVSVMVLGAGSAAAAGYVATQSASDETTVESDSSHVVAEVPVATEEPEELMESVTAGSDSGEVQTMNESAVADSTVISPQVACPTVEAASAPQPMSPPEPSVPDPEAQKQAYRQVARILSNMGDAEVAQLLAHIEDEEIEVILRNVTAREGARILSQLSGERAAQLSRRLLSVTNESGSEN